jgi:uncharacterized protein (UPF0333 family)
MFGKKRGQSTLEYGLLIAVIVIALLAINLYLKRGVQGRMRESTDQIGRQFDPEKFALSWRTTSTSNTAQIETRANTGEITTNITQGEKAYRSEHDEFGYNALYNTVRTTGW